MNWGRKPVDHGGRRPPRFDPGNSLISQWAEISSFGELPSRWQPSERSKEQHLASLFFHRVRILLQLIAYVPLHMEKKELLSYLSNFLKRQKIW